MNIQHLQPTGFAGNAYLNLPIEAAAPTDGRIKGIGPIGGCNYYYLSSGGKAVHKGQELSHHTPLQVAGHLLAFGCDGVDLINEDDRGSGFSGLLEDLAQPLLAFSIELGDDLRTGDGNEVGVGLAGHGPGDERLSRAGRSVQQHPAGWIDTQAREELRMAQWNFNHLPDLSDLAGKAADILVGDIPHLQCQLF